jgi:hypothetical protein
LQRFFNEKTAIMNTQYKLHVESVQTRVDNIRFWSVWVLKRHARVWFLHAEIDFHTQKNQLKSTYTFSNLIRLLKKIWIGFWLAAMSHARMWLSHLSCDFDTLHDWLLYCNIYMNLSCRHIDIKNYFCLFFNKSQKHWRTFRNLNTWMITNF